MFNFREWLGLGFYTSNLDKFLQNFRKTHPQLSASQRKEQEKHAKIHEPRTTEVNPLWEKF